MLGYVNYYNCYGNNYEIFFNFNYLLLFITFRLGLANRSQCEQALQQTGWSLELAAAVLLETTS